MVTDVILVLNAGSSSIKFSMFAVESRGLDLAPRYRGARADRRCDPRPAGKAGQPPVSQLYALPRDRSATGIKRYGFHGLSYEYIASVLAGSAFASIRRPTSLVDRESAPRAVRYRYGWSRRMRN
jgi:hypothetical protein